MTRPIKPSRRVVVPRPKGARKSKRAALVLNMHPRQLRDLEDRAAAASMALGPYVTALLFSGEEPEACAHGVPITADGAGACVRCRKDKREGLALLAGVTLTHGTVQFRPDSEEPDALSRAFARGHAPRPYAESPPLWDGRDGPRRDGPD